MGSRPDRILITSLFTYWSHYVHEAAAFYHAAYPSAKIEIGGIYASLMPEHCKRSSPFATVSRGFIVAVRPRRFQSTTRCCQNRLITKSSTFARLP